MVAGAIGLGSGGVCIPIGNRSAVGTNSLIGQCCPVIGARGGSLGNDSPVAKCLSATTLTTSLAGAPAAGGRFPFLEVSAGTPVTDTAVLSGANASAAGGTVTYTVYASASLKLVVTGAGTVAVTNGVVPPSNPEVLPKGTYFWKATYSGDALNEPSGSNIGWEVVVKAPSIT
jgi:hypothetical protein